MNKNPNKYKFAKRYYTCNVFSGLKRIKTIKQERRMKGKGLPRTHNIYRFIKRHLLGLEILELCVLTTVSECPHINEYKAKVSINGKETVIINTDQSTAKRKLKAFYNLNK